MRYWQMVVLGIVACSGKSSIGGGDGLPRGGGAGAGGDAGMPSSAGRGAGRSAGGGTGGATVTSGTGGLAGADDGTGGSTGGSTRGGTGSVEQPGGGESNGASAGTGELPDECTVHADCAEKYPDFDSVPRACVSGTCVPLLTKECPLLLPVDSAVDALRSTDAIILGGFARVGGGAPYPHTDNYNLALTELAEQTGGVFAGTANRHALVMVVCEPDWDPPEDVLIPGRHLIEDLRVKGIVGSFFTDDGRYLFEQLGRANDVFFIDALAPDQALVDLPDDGLVWQSLSGPNTFSVSAQSFWDMLLVHLQGLGLAAKVSPSIKAVTVTTTDEPFSSGVSQYWEEHVAFTSAPGEEVTTTWKRLDTQFPNVDKDALAQEIVDFAPQLVVGATADMMLSHVIPYVESHWDATNATERPIYVLMPQEWAEFIAPELIANDDSASAGKLPLHERMLGFTWPAAPDSTAKDDYELRLQAAYGELYKGYGNVYDATYDLMYAVAAVRGPITGSSIAAGMVRVTSGTEVATVGPGPEMSDNITLLATDASYKLRLVGTQGPPNWDDTGARMDAASVWCVDELGNYFPNALLYNPDTQQLEGTFPCFTFPAQ